MHHAGKGTTRKDPDLSSSSLPASASINITYVNEQVADLAQRLPKGFCAVTTDANAPRRSLKLQGLNLKLLKQQFPKNGEFWPGGLVRWLRSSPVVQVVKLCAEVSELCFDSCISSILHLSVSSRDTVSNLLQGCFQNPGVHAQLDEYLPMAEFPWKRQHKAIVDLAKRADAGRSRHTSDQDARHLLAKYSRKLFLCTRETLISNSPDSEDHFVYRLLDLPCAVILTAYYDLKMQKNGIFATLLNSPLVLAMHAGLRKKLENHYPIDRSLNTAKDDASIIWTPSSTSPTYLDTVDSEVEVDHKADYNLEPFNDREKMGFMIAYRDWPQADPVTSIAHTVNFKYIAEILPGRCVPEVEALYKLHESSLKIQAHASRTTEVTPIKRPAKRPRHIESDSDELPKKTAKVAQRISKSPKVPSDAVPTAPEGTTEANGPMDSDIGADVNEGSRAETTEERAKSPIPPNINDLGKSAEIASPHNAEVGAGTSHLTPGVSQTTATTTSANKVSSACAKYLQPTPSWRPELRQVDYLGTGEVLEKNMARIMAGKKQLDRLCPKPVTNTKGRIALKPTPSSKTTARHASRATESSTKPKPRGTNQSPAAAAGSPLVRSSEKHALEQQSVRRPQDQRDRADEAVRAVEEVTPKEHDATEKTPAKPVELRGLQDMKNDSVPSQGETSSWPALPPERDVGDEGWESADDLVEHMRNSTASRLREQNSS